jgi:hypothetical protein
MLGREVLVLSSVLSMEERSAMMFVMVLEVLLGMLELLAVGMSGRAVLVLLSVLSMEERSAMMLVMVLEVLLVCWDEQCWFLLSAMILVMMLVFVSFDVGLLLVCWDEQCWFCRRCCRWKNGRR